jgi:hypothetical protein
VTTAPLYVYGVVSIDERDSVSVAGVEGSPVGMVEHDGLAAITSPLQGKQLRAAREVRAHMRVLQETAETATVLPVRFGTVLEDEHAVRERLLEPNAAHLDALLKQLAGCVQLNVKGDYDEDVLVRQIVTASPALSKLAKRVRAMPEAAAYYDRIQLGEGIAAAVGARRESDTGRALDQLAPAAVAARSETPTSTYQALNLAFLVRRDGQDEFTARVRDLVAELGDEIDVRYVGPLPPYSFAEGELEAA